MSRAHVVVSKALQTVRKLFARVHATHRGGTGLIPGQNMSGSGPLVEDGDDLGQVCPRYLFHIARTLY
jgi:hypothetical protein